MFIKKNYLPIIFLLLIIAGKITPLVAQTPSNSSIGKITTASPTAASLAKFGDIPVSEHTGIPDIGIPIYNISTGPLSMPVSLSYHAYGLKS